MMWYCNSGESDVVLSLADDVRTWQPGDKIVTASSDYDMHQAEVFSLVRCHSCTANQVKLSGEYQARTKQFDIGPANPFSSSPSSPSSP